MEYEEPPVCKVQVSWPTLTEDEVEGFDIDYSSPFERFQEMPSSGIDLAVLLSDSASLEKDASTTILVAGDGSVEVSSKILTAFSEHFARMSQSNMKEVATRTVELVNFSLSTLKSMISYMKTADLPSDLDELRNLYELSGYILHQPMERHIARTLLQTTPPEQMAPLADFAVTQPTGVLYSYIMQHFARSCSQSWFKTNILGPDGISLAVVRDLLRRDDLNVSSETEVMSIIRSWMSSHTDGTYEDFADTVRVSWLPKSWRTPFMCQQTCAQSSSACASTSSACASTSSAVQHSEYCRKPRHRYTRHVHLITVERIVNLHQHDDLFVESRFGLDLPRFPPPSKFSSFVNLLCSVEGKPTQCLSTVELPDPGGWGTISTQTPYKVIYFEEFGRSMSPVAFMTVSGGLTKLQVKPQLTCGFLSLDSYAETSVTKLVDICACYRGLLVYLQKAEVDLIVLYPKHGDDSQLVLVINEPMTRPRLYIQNDLLHVECLYAGRTNVISMIVNFELQRQFHGSPVVSDYHIACDDLKEFAAELQVRSNKERLEAGESSSTGAHCGDTMQNTLAKGSAAGPSKWQSGMSWKEDSSSLVLLCNNDLRFNQRKTVSLSILPKGPEILRIEGQPVTLVMGFVPRHTFTINDGCEPLPIS